MKATDLLDYIPEIGTFKHYGKVKRVIGLMIESLGPESSIGDVCYIHVDNKKIRKKSLPKLSGSVTGMSF